MKDKDKACHTNDCSIVFLILTGIFEMKYISCQAEQSPSEACQQQEYSQQTSSWRLFKLRDVIHR